MATNTPGVDAGRGDAARGRGTPSWRAPSRSAVRRSSAGHAFRALKTRSRIPISALPEGVPQSGPPAGHGTGPAITADHWKTCLRKGVTPCVHSIFPPLFSTTVGFDRMARLLEQVPSETAPTYPPYNIQKMGENAYRVTLAVAGFGEDEIGVEVKENLLTVAGKLAKENGANESYLHRGIATPRVRAALQPRRSHPGNGRGARQGAAAHRLGARAPRSAQGAQDRHRDRRPEADRPQGLLIGSDREFASRSRRKERGRGPKGSCPCAVGIAFVSMRTTRKMSA